MRCALAYDDLEQLRHIKDSLRGAHLTVASGLEVAFTSVSGSDMRLLSAAGDVLVEFYRGVIGVQVRNV